MKDFIKLLTAVISCELVGILGAIFTTQSIPTWYAQLNKPPFSPPNWLFGPVWTLLYLLMGISFYLIWKQESKKKSRKQAIQLFLIQLGMNFVWSPIFFGLRDPLFGLVIIVSMWWFIVATIRAFFPLSKTAAYLLIPYILWVSFATILNAAIVVLN
jgi:tryptophan-rich sensory protein